MRIIKVDAINSTNSFLRERMKEFPLENICAVAEYQQQGRGQMGTNWQSEKGKNLTFSMLFRELKLPAKKQFQLSMEVSLAVLEVLKELNIENPIIKWPNDILAGNKKVAGILIENILKGDKIDASIIGIGLNVNQEVFFDLPQAASLKNLSGKSYDLVILLEKLLSTLECNIEKKPKRSELALFEKYHQNLFGMHQKNIFQLPNGTRFWGKIQGVDTNGKLIILDENNEQKSFQLKEVKMIMERG